MTLSFFEVMHWWTWSPAVLLILCLAKAIYVRGFLRLTRRKGPGVAARRREAAFFYAGLAVVAGALLSPVDKLSSVLFSAHMGQHELLMLIAAPLIVLGRPVPNYLHGLPSPLRQAVVAFFRRPAVLGTWRFLTGPIVALVVHGFTRWIWHAPALFQACLEHPALHSFQHFTFFWTAALFWWALVHGRYGKNGYGIAVLFVFLTAGHTGALGAIFALAPSVVYPLYAARGAAYHVDALHDQELAGLVMWVAAGTAFVFFGLALFAAWMGEARRRVRKGRVAVLTGANA